MSILPCSPRTVAPKNTPIPEDLTPEQRLGVAVLRQALADTRAASPQIRAEALRFWATPGAVQFWDELLGLEGTLQRRVQALRLPYERAS